MGFYRPTKDLIWLWLITIPVFGAEQAAPLCGLLLKDITIRKKLEHTIKISNFKYVTKLHQTSSGIGM
jgi:hypothetical protein